MSVSSHVFQARLSAYKVVYVLFRLLTSSSFCNLLRVNIVLTVHENFCLPVMLMCTTSELKNTGVENLSCVSAIRAEKQLSREVSDLPIRISNISKSRGCITLQPDFLESLKVTV